MAAFNGVLIDLNFNNLIIMLIGLRLKASILHLFLYALVFNLKNKKIKYKINSYIETTSEVFCFDILHFHSQLSPKLNNSWWYYYFFVWTFCFCKQFYLLIYLFSFYLLLHCCGCVTLTPRIQNAHTHTRASLFVHRHDFVKWLADFMV